MTQEPTETPGVDDSAVEPSSAGHKGRTPLWIAGAAIVVVAIVALVWVTRPDTGSSEGAGSTGPAKQASVDATGAPASVGSRQRGPTSSPSKNAPAAAGDSATGGAVTGDAAAGSPAPATVNELPAAGSQLTTITQPPAATLSMIDASAVPQDARYTIEFRPFGYGPQRSDQPTLVIHLDTCTPTNDSGKGLDLEGRNLLAAALAGEDPVTAGGSYAGVLSFRPWGDLLSPVISEIRKLD